MYLYYSLASLRNILPEVTANQTIFKTLLPDTLINKQHYSRVQFTLHKQVLGSLFASFTNLTKDITYKYTLIIDKNTYLPYAYIQFNPDNKDFTQTTFTNINLHLVAPTEQSWHLAFYAKTYKTEKPKLTLIQAGKQAPNWQLVSFNSNKTFTLDQYKGKLVMLEFWFKNCGPCIEGVPALNDLCATYQSRSFQLLGLNIEDSKTMIKVFKEKNQVSYPLLYGVAAVGNEYGVTNCPTIVLIDRDGKVLYAGEFDKKAITQLIDTHL